MKEVVPVVLVIIVLLAWAIILGPSVVKRRAHGGGHQSITHFHHQLSILEHSAPEPIVAPAYRLRAVDGGGTPTGITYPGTTPPKLTVVGAKELPRPALAFLGEPEPGRDTVPEPASTAMVRPVGRHDEGHHDEHLQDSGHGYGYGYGADVPSRPRQDGWTSYAAVPVEPDAGHRGDSFARRQARRRRRDTLSVLATVLVATMLLAVVTGSSAVWAVFALDGVALAGYVALLVHLRRGAVERERKLRYLDIPDVGRPARLDGPPTYVSGRYAHPSNQHAVAR